MKIISASEQDKSEIFVPAFHEALRIVAKSPQLDTNKPQRQKTPLEEMIDKHHRILSDIYDNYYRQQRHKQISPPVYRPVYQERFTYTVPDFCFAVTV